MNDTDRVTYLSGSSDDLERLRELRKRVDGEFLWVRRDGREFVTSDAQVLATVRRAWATIEPVSAKMEVLGGEMEKHGEVMEAIGKRMEAQWRARRPTVSKSASLPLPALPAGAPSAVRWSTERKPEQPVCRPHGSLAAPVAPSRDLELAAVTGGVLLSRASAPHRRWAALGSRRVACLRDVVPVASREVRICAMTTPCLP
jgi:hypothetical protein